MQSHVTGKQNHSHLDAPELRFLLPHEGSLGRGQEMKHFVFKTLFSIQ